MHEGHLGSDRSYDLIRTEVRQTMLFESDRLVDNNLPVLCQSLFRIFDVECVVWLEHKRIQGKALDAGKY
jgi:hypothetical protein